MCVQLCVWVHFHPYGGWISEERYALCWSITAAQGGNVWISLHICGSITSMWYVRQSENKKSHTLLFQYAVTVCGLRLCHVSFSNYCNQPCVAPGSCPSHSDSGSIQYSQHRQRPVECCAVPTTRWTVNDLCMAKKGDFSVACWTGALLLFHFRLINTLKQWSDNNHIDITTISST